MSEDREPLDARRTAETKAQYDRHSASYDKLLAPVERLIFGKLRRQLWSSLRGADVLEVGVGTGINMRYYPPEVAVTAIDLSSGMLSLARQRAERDAVAVRLLEMDAQDLQFAADSFDAAVSTLAFCAVPHPVLGLREIRRVLKPAGSLLMLEHVRPPGLLGVVFDLLNPLTVRCGSENINRRTVENVRRAGFEIDRVESHALGILVFIVAHRPAPC